MEDSVKPVHKCDLCRYSILVLQKISLINIW